MNSLLPKHSVADSGTYSVEFHVFKSWVNNLPSLQIVISTNYFLNKELVEILTASQAASNLTICLSNRYFLVKTILEDKICRLELGESQSRILSKLAREHQNLNSILISLLKPILWVSIAKKEASLNVVCCGG
jgi:hypothetical protein